MSRAALVLVLLLPALPATAAAKGPGGVEAGLTVCGATGCTTTPGDDPKDLGAFLAGDKTGPPSSGAPFYQVTLPMRTPAPDGEGPLWEVLYVPSSGLLRSTDGTGRPIWLQLPPSSRAAYDRLVRGKEPLPPGALPGVLRPAPATGGGVPAWLIALAGAGALAAVAGAVVATRRRRRPPLVPTALVLALGVVLALGAAGAAAAKELASVKVCGANGCKTLDGHGQDEGILQGGGITSPPAGGAPFYRVTFRIAIPGDAGGEPPVPWTVLYVPSKGLLRAEEGESGKHVWLGLLPGQRGAYEKAVRGIEPLPASALPGVRGRSAPAPARAAGGDGDGVPGWLIALGGAAAVIAAAAGALAHFRRGRARAGLAPAPPPV